MTNQKDTERLCIFVAGEEVTIKCAGKSEVHLPLRVFCRSTVLQQALDDALEESDATIVLPVGVLESWIDGLENLQMDVCPTCSEHAENGAHKPAKRQKTAFSMASSLIAADFLDDKEALKGLCALACQQLFDPILSSKLAEIDGRMAEELCRVPETLQQAVLATAEAIPLLLQLFFLPAALQDAAMHAAHPSIAASASLTTRTRYKSSSCLEPFWATVGRMKELEHLTIIGNGMMSSLEMLRALPKLASLTRLRTLSIRNFDEYIAVQLLEPAAQCLRHLTGLEDLDFSSNDVMRSISKASSENHHYYVIFDVIGSLRNLTRLDFSSNPFGFEEEAVRALGRALSNLPKLLDLNLAGCRASVQKAALLAEHLAWCSDLSRLNLADNDGDAAVKLINSLSKISCLKSLDCSLQSWGSSTKHCFSKLTSLQVLKIRITDSFFEAPELFPGFRAPQPPGSHADPMNELAQCIAAFTGLQELHMPEAELSKDSMKQLCTHLTTLSPLRNLHLIYEFKCDDGSEGTSLAALLSHLPNLEALHLEPTARLKSEDEAIINENGALVMQRLGRDEDSFKAVQALVPSLYHLTALQHLNLAHLYVSHTSAELLCQNVQGLTALRTLNLADTSLGSKGADLVADLLPRLLHLQHLDLSLNQFSAEEAESLADHIGLLSALTALSLAGNAIGAGGMIAVAMQLSNLTSLQRLDLSGAHSGIAGSNALAQYLGCLTALQMLELTDALRAGSSADALGAAVGNLTSLTYLSLESNGISVSEIEGLGPHLVKLKSLQNLNLKANQLGNEGSAALARFVTRMTSLQELNVVHCDCDDEKELMSCDVESREYMTLRVVSTSFRSLDLRRY